MIPIKTPRPRDYVEGTLMTPEQLDRWMKAMTKAERLTLIHAMQVQSERGHNCQTMDHEGQLEQTSARLSEVLMHNARLKESAVRL